MIKLDNHNIDLEGVIFLRMLVEFLNSRNESMNMNKNPSHLIAEYTRHINNDCDLDGNLTLDTYGDIKNAIRFEHMACKGNPNYEGLDHESAILDAVELVLGFNAQEDESFIDFSINASMTEIWGHWLNEVLPKLKPESWEIIT